MQGSVPSCLVFVLCFLLVWVKEGSSSGEGRRLHLLPSSSPIRPLGYRESVNNVACGQGASHQCTIISHLFLRGGSGGPHGVQGDGGVDEDHDSLMGIPDTGKGKGKGDAGGSSPSPPTQPQSPRKIALFFLCMLSAKLSCPWTRLCLLCLSGGQVNLLLHLTWLFLGRRAPRAVGGFAALRPRQGSNMAQGRVGAPFVCLCPAQSRRRQALVPRYAPQGPGYLVQPVSHSDRCEPGRPRFPRLLAS
jgi:hypothetical protein